MGKRLTRAMADFAAGELAEIAFDKKIEEADSKMKEFGDKMILKYIPSPVIALAKEYTSLFYDNDNHISIGVPYKSLHLISNVMNPISRKHFIISEEDYNVANELVMKCRDLKSRKEDYVQKVSDALMQLRTEARISQHFPEALPYLNFSDTTAIVPNYENLRMQLK